MNVLFAFLLLFSGVAVGGVKEDEDATARREMIQMVERMKAQKVEREKEQDRRWKTPPFADVVGVDPAQRQGPEWASGWKRAEMNRGAGLLGGVEVDLLVVPFQVQANGIERANRSLMSAVLSQALSASVKVADPYLVSRALGDGERRLDRLAVLQLANTLRAKRILWTYAGHRFDNRLQLFFQFQDRGAQQAFADTPSLPGKLIDSLAFSDDLAPITSFRKGLPQILETLGFKAPTTVVNAPGKIDASVPATLAALVQATGQPGRDALHLQFLASLVPSDAQRLRERLFERSLLIAWQLDPGQASSRLLLARAYHGLHMRPAALAALGKVRSDEEKALQAALNGNLPELDAVRNRLPMSLHRIMAEIDATDMRYAYGSDLPDHAEARARLLSKLPAPWATVASRRFGDSDPIRLRRFGNFELLKFLGSEFPNAVPGIEQLLRGNLVSGQGDSAEIDLALGRYLDPALSRKARAVCCTASPWSMGRLDIQDFLVQSAMANIVYKALRLSSTQGLPREAIDYVNSLDPVFGGHPSLMNARAISENSLAALADGPAKQGLFDKAESSRQRAAYWSEGVTHFDSDRPSYISHPFYNADGRAAPPMALSNARAALANATFQPGPLKAVFHLTATTKDKQALLGQVAGRFSGDSTLPMLSADLMLAQDKPDEAKALLAAALKSRPAQADIYARLGRLLADAGQYAEAAGIYAQYPGLQQPGGKALEVDNYAHEVGSLFFWRGETELAIPFFKISADLQTGSHAGMTSVARLAVIQSNFSLALSAQRDAAQRYGNSYRYRDYFSLLHMLGQGDVAWDGFHAMVTRLMAPHVWDSALVGHQRQGLDEKGLIEWARRPALNPEGRNAAYLARYLTLAAVTDRIPGGKLADAVNVAGGYSLPVRSAESHFVLAYAALKKKDFAAAYQHLQVAGKHNSMTAEGSYMLPYFAIAAIRAGKSGAVDELLQAMDKPNRRFDYWLARCAVSALNGGAEAEAHFRQAINTRVFTERRPVGVEYQLADIAEILFELTGNPAFKSLAIKVAAFNQKIQPWEAWSYAVEATLADDRAARKRALVSAVYLDRNSGRLARLPREDVSEALRTLEKAPPFRSPQRGRTEI